MGLGGDFVLTSYSDRSGWSPHEVQHCVPFAHPWDFLWNGPCTHLPLLHTFTKNLMELFPTQCAVDTWSIFLVIWWSLAASLWTIVTVYRFRATDGWSLLGLSSRFQGPYILSKSRKPFRVIHARQSISVYNLERYICYRGCISRFRPNLMFGCCFVSTKKFVTYVWCC